MNKQVIKDIKEILNGLEIIYQDDIVLIDIKNSCYWIAGVKHKLTSHILMDMWKEYVNSPLNEGYWIKKE